MCGASRQSRAASEIAARRCAGVALPCAFSFGITLPDIFWPILRILAQFFVLQRRGIVSQVPQCAAPRARAARVPKSPRGGMRGFSAMCVFVQIHITRPNFAIFAYSCVIFSYVLSSLCVSGGTMCSAWRWSREDSSSVVRGCFSWRLILDFPRFTVLLHVLLCHFCEFSSSSSCSRAMRLYV
jgi:hypothetical protein